MSEKKKVLIVDDNDMTRRMNKSKLMLDGFTVLEAIDGVEAIKVLETEVPDVIVLDLYMEKMDGFKVLALLKGSPKWKDIPVIVFSARGTPVEIEKAMSAGADEFLVKMTTSPVKLSERVKGILKV
ncbi:MAG: response regulator [Nitrospirae bacterium]|nr:response regulator [Nitrospirota bacterium]